MAFLSRQPLPSEVRTQIERTLAETFRATNGAVLLNELLTETESLMLAKRLSTILMLLNEQSYYRIDQILGVSVSTSKRIHKQLIGGQFAELEKLTTSKKKRQQIIDDIGSLLYAGLPPRTYVIKKRGSKRKKD